MRRRLFSKGGAASSGDGLDVGALAPMVDMMTLLLVFLLRSYATEAAPAPPDGPWSLAGTHSEAPRQGGVVILVSPEAIWVDGQRVAAIAYLPPDLLIRGVYDRLLGVRNKGRVEIYADATVPYGVVKKVLHSARAAGFSELSLVGASGASL
jgi:biopolymer transport protein ExbD